jgi:hypothetical protein
MIWILKVRRRWAQGTLKFFRVVYGPSIVRWRWGHDLHYKFWVNNLLKEFPILVFNDRGQAGGARSRSQGSLKHRREWLTWELNYNVMNTLIAGNIWWRDGLEENHWQVKPNCLPASKTQAFLTYNYSMHRTWKAWRSSPGRSPT